MSEGNTPFPPEPPAASLTGNKRGSPLMTAATAQLVVPRSMPMHVPSSSPLTTPPRESAAPA
eukprot:scaffold29927_cov23-Tisochrysis_lutea.AAC.5